MVHYKLKKKWKIVILIIILICLVLVGIKYINYRNSNEYGFKELGYTKEEIKILTSKTEAMQTKLLSLEKSDNYLKLFKEKYYLEKNFDRYIAYKKENKEKTLTQVVSLVNVNRDRDYYEEPIKADTSLKTSILVNKYYALDSTFVPEAVVDVSSWYAYAGRQATEEAYNAFIEMYNDAREVNLKLLLNSGYRSYESQNAVYTEYDRDYGEEFADSYAARPGHSEHQTGLGYDIASPNATMSDFETTEEFKWLQENSYKYGFILRYPKDKEDITGFAYEPWHYRYLGKDLALKVKNENITFDEYYAFYIEK